MTTTVATTLAQGSSLSPAVVQQVAQLETQQAEGTRMEWIWTCQAVKVPALHVGPIHIPATQLVAAHQIAEGFAALLNALAGAGHTLAGIATWPGEPLAVAVGNQVQIRWVKGNVWSPALVAALAGIGTAALGLLTASGIGDAVAALITALLVSVGVYVAIHAWKVVAWVVHQVQGLGNSPYGLWLGLAAIAVGGYLVLRNL